MSTNIQSYSQAGQDLFVYNCLMKNDLNYKGTYLDIGACEPITINNTYLLEQFGWEGVSIDIDSYHSDKYKLRTTHFVNRDAIKIDWDDLREQYPFLKNTIDYLSLDIDDNTLSLMRIFPFEKYRFRVLTVEHDGYRFGDKVKNEIRTILKNNGYEIICSDVKYQCPNNGPLAIFEDWWVDPNLVNMNIVERYRSDNQFWHEIVYR